MRKLLRYDLSKGFTLVELILSVALLSILFSSSTIFYSRFLLQNEVNSTVEKLANSLHKAKMYSMAAKHSGQWGVRIISGTIVLFNGPTYSTRNATYDEIYTVNSNVNLSGLTEVVFTKLEGKPSTPASVTITSGNNIRNLTMNSIGVIQK